jgi:hypothetical protein
MADVKISSEVRAYLHNIIVFMRLHRAVAGGISAMATRHFNTLAQYVTIPDTSDHNLTVAVLLRHSTASIISRRR